MDIKGPDGKRQDRGRNRCTRDSLREVYGQSDAILYFFKVKPLLVRLYLHSRPEVRRHRTNHLYHTALEGAHHHNCNYNYHSLRAVRPRGKHQPDKQKTLHSENFFLQLLTPPTEETNGGPTG